MAFRFAILSLILSICPPAEAKPNTAFSRFCSDVEGAFQTKPSYTAKMEALITVLQQMDKGHLPLQDAYRTATRALAGLNPQEKYEAFIAAARKALGDHNWRCPILKQVWSFPAMLDRCQEQQSGKAACFAFLLDQVQGRQKVKTLGRLRSCCAQTVLQPKVSEEDATVCFSLVQKDIRKGRIKTMLRIERGLCRGPRPPDEQRCKALFEWALSWAAGGAQKRRSLVEAILDVNRDQLGPCFPQGQIKGRLKLRVGKAGQVKVRVSPRTAQSCVQQVVQAWPFPPLAGAVTIIQKL